VLVALCAFAIFVAPDDPKLDGPLHMERELSMKVELTLTETLTGYANPLDRWQVDAALPPTYDAQTVHAASFYIPTEPQTKSLRLKEKGGLGQFYLSVSLKDPSPKPITVQSIYEVSLYKRKLVEGVSPEKPFPMGALKLQYTAAHPWLDMGTAAFKDWLKEEELMKKGSESDLKFAWRAFKDIAARFEYDPDAEGLTPLATINQKASNTLGLANLYLAILRINEIPARFVVCRPLLEFKDQENQVLDTRFDEQTTDVLVEFWTDDIGWIPTDIVRAAGYHEPSELFGKMEGYFLALHFDIVQFTKGEYVFLDRMNWARNAGLEEAKVKRKIELRKL
jgi:transglutaminase-like putative cysteine protease